MRGRPEHLDQITALLKRCADIEDGVHELPAPHCSIARLATDDLVIHLRVSWVIERLHRAKLTTGEDDRRQNLADAVAARDELRRRLRAPRRHRSTAGPTR